MLVIGPMVPPIHGASIVTSAMVTYLKGRGHSVRVLNTSPAATGGPLGYHLSRLWACLRNVAGILTGESHATVYMVPSGGLGLVYDTIMVAACAMKGHRMVFQHHSFAYINQISPLMRFIVRVSGTGQRHITSCARMAQFFRRNYGADLSVSPISNLPFFAQELEAAIAGPRTGPIVLGYLANITKEKGVDRFLDVMAALRTRGSTATAVIAGPYTGPGIEAYLQSRLSQLPGVHYAGPLYGEAKKAFFRSLDMFVFLSRYVNETQPLVVYEAMAASVRVAVTDRGCLGDMIGEDDIVLDLDASDIEPVVNAVLEMERTRAAGEETDARNLRRQRLFRQAVADEVNALDAFFAKVDG